MKENSSEFIATFVQECLLLGKNTPEDISTEAKQRISEIDKQLQLRSKLVDVIRHFRPLLTKSNESNIEKLTYNQELITDILQLISENGIEISEFIRKTEHNKEIIHTVKHLILNDTLIKKNNWLYVGSANAIIRQTEAMAPDQPKATA